MKNWIIKLLGGYTEHEYNMLGRAYDNYYVSETKLKQSQKNDTPRDPKTGRFVKK